MEAAQLSYFLLAYQFRNHAEAAQSASVSASALSENIDALERELGLTLFERGRYGHYPTEAARWLHQRVEPVLHTVEAVEALFRAGEIPRVRRIEVTSPLQFMAGALSRAANLALRSIAHAEPGVIGAATFALAGPSSHFEEVALEPVPSAASIADTHVTIEYAADFISPSDTRLFEDRWVAVSHARGSEKPEALSIDALRRSVILVPALGDAQMRQISGYCRTHDLREPQVIEEDIGALAWLERRPPASYLVAPFSLIAASAARSALRVDDLPKPLATSVVACAVGPDDLGLRYIQHLLTALAMPTPLAYRTTLSFRQLQSFLALADNPNVTATARLLHIAQPALSKQLRKLEGVLETLLFERRQTGLAPLPTAECLAGILRPVLEAIESIGSDAAHYAAIRRERLTIGLLPVTDHDGPLARGVAAAIEAWSRIHPKVELRIVEGVTEALKRGIEAGDMGLALVEAQVSRTWQADLAFEDIFGLVTAGSRPAPASGTIALREALDMSLALPATSFGLRKLIDKAAADIGAHVVPRMEINALPILLALVKRTGLATILPASSVSALVETGAFHLTPIRDPVITRRLSILFSPDRSLSEIERDFISTLRRHLSDALVGSITPPRRAALANE